MVRVAVCACSSPCQLYSLGVAAYNSLPAGEVGVALQLAGRAHGDNGEHVGEGRVRRAVGHPALHYSQENSDL